MSDLHFFNVPSIKPYIDVVGGLIVERLIQFNLYIINRTTKLDFKIINLTLLII